MMDLHNESGRRWMTAVLVGAALLSAAYWAEATLRAVNVKAPAAASTTSAAAPTAPPAEALAKLLGAQPRAQAAPLGPADRFKVLGVIASASGRGTALVAVDGQPARAYSVGTELAPGFELRAVSPKDITLAAPQGGDVLATLPLPLPSQEPGSAGSGTSAGPAGSPSTPAGPPVVSGSRGNPRSVEPPRAP